MSNKATFDLDDLAEVFKALSNPNRLRIFFPLATCCSPGTVGIINGGQSA